MSAHTPAPWEAVFSENGGYDCMTDSIDIRPVGEGFQPAIVYIVRGRDPDKTMERDWANAHLIAAVPELLTALKAHSGERRIALGSIHRKRISAAIAKAEGR